MRERMSQHWWTLALRGFVAVVFGLMTLVLPGETLIILVYLFAAYALMDGVLAIFAALRLSGSGWTGELALVAEGILGCAAGVYAFLYPAMAAVVFAYFVAAWAVATGALAVVTAVRARRHIPDEQLWIVAGAASLVLGVAIAAFPLAGVVAFTYMIGMFALIFGFALLSLAFRLRKMGRDVATAI